MNRERFSETTSSLRVGRCAISTVAPLSTLGEPLFDLLFGTAVVRVFNNQVVVKLSKITSNKVRRLAVLEFGYQ
jgi:hypothetical protein